MLEKLVAKYDTCQYRGILYHACSVLFMGISPVLSKIGLISLSPLLAAGINCFIVFLLVMYHHDKISIRAILANYKKLSFIALLNSIAIGSFFVALNLTSADVVVFIGRFYVFFVVLWGIIFLKEYIPRERQVFLFLGFAGLLMYSYKTMDLDYYIGIFVSLTSAIFFSCSNFYTKQLLSYVNKDELLLSTNLIASIFLITIYLTTIDQIVSPSKTDIFFIFLGAFFGNFLGVRLFYKGLHATEFYKAGVVRSFTPVLTMLYSIPVFGLPNYSLLNWIGGGILLICLVCFFLPLDKVKFKQLQDK